MKKEDLITKWLNNEQLTKQEAEAFEQLDAFESYVKIAETARQFSAPEFDIQGNQEILKKKLSGRTMSTSRKTMLPVMMRIAAIFVIGIGLYFAFFNEHPTTITTIASEKLDHQLPDESKIKLNAVSSLTYNEKNWNNERKVTLEGEAYFQVAQGKKFDVHTSAGIVSVIGTKFNIKQRDDFFEVSCYEGVVSVTIDDETKYLRAGDVLQLFEEKIIESKFSDRLPSWYANNKSLFYRTPFDKVLKELKWQYGVTVKTKNIDTSKLFTGNFVHSDIKLALQSIAIPMRLKYMINNKTVTLYKE